MAWVAYDEPKASSLLLWSASFPHARDNSQARQNIDKLQATMRASEEDSNVGSGRSAASNYSEQALDWDCSYCKTKNEVVLAWLVDKACKTCKALPVTHGAAQVLPSFTQFITPIVAATTPPVDIVVVHAPGCRPRPISICCRLRSQPQCI
jgi:hypothetical protein